MKKSLVIFLIFTPFTLISQSSVKIFAYSQTETPGIIPKGVTDENGNSVKIGKEPHVNYYIFATHPTSDMIRFTKICVKGNLYSVKTQKIDSTPVIKVKKDNADNSEKEVLVPYTNSRVVSIIPEKPINDIVSHLSWFKNMAKNNELILSYMYNGKKYFIGVKKIKLLEPFSNL